MITDLLSRLFKDDSLYPYEPRPHHALLGVVLMFLGSVAAAYGDGFSAFGILTVIIGFIQGMVVTLAVLWSEMTKYWQEINSFADRMSKERNPQVWRALGFTPPAPERVVIEEKLDMGQGMGSTKIKELPAGPETMRAIADFVLTGTSLTEPEIVHRLKLMSGPKFRQLKTKLEKMKMIRPNNEQHRNLGFSLTKKGRESFLEFASESVKQMTTQKRLEG